MIVTSVNQIHTESCSHFGPGHIFQFYSPALLFALCPAHQPNQTWTNSPCVLPSLLLASVVSSTQNVLPQSFPDVETPSWYHLLITYVTNSLSLIPEKATAPHSSTLAWKIPWMEEPGGLQSMGSLGVGHDRVTSLSLFSFMHWRRQWQPTPVFLPGEFQGRGSLVGCRLWDRTESDTTEAT